MSALHNQKMSQISLKYYLCARFITSTLHLSLQAIRDPIPEMMSGNEYTVRSYRQNIKQTTSEALASTGDKFWV